jgi:polyhydroxyalkanoate synthesis repressor PhaR
MTVLIKRYANRKLYNTQTSRYITLKGIAELLENHEDVQVIDNETGEDITSVALSQILVGNEREQRSVPGTLLSDLIHRGGDALYGALRKGVDDASGSIEDFQRNVRNVIKPSDDETGKFADWIALGKPDIDALVQNAMERVFKLLDLPRRSDIASLNENLEKVAQAIDRLAPAADSDPDSTQPPESDERPPASEPSSRPAG